MVVVCVCFFVVVVVVVVVETVVFFIFCLFVCFFHVILKVNQQFKKYNLLFRIKLAYANEFHI